VKTTSSFALLLIRTLGKAFFRQRMIDTGKVANPSELARRFKLETGWVCEVLRLQPRAVGDKDWWPGTELNRRHKDFQSSALPTELPGHCTAERP